MRWIVPLIVPVSVVVLVWAGYITWRADPDEPSGIEIVAEVILLIAFPIGTLLWWMLRDRSEPPRASS